MWLSTAPQRSANRPEGQAARYGAGATGRAALKLLDWHLRFYFLRSLRSFAAIQVCMSSCPNYLARLRNVLASTTILLAKMNTRAAANTNHQKMGFNEMFKL